MSAKKIVADPAASRAGRVEAKERLGIRRQGPLSLGEGLVETHRQAHRGAGELDFAVLHRVPGALIWRVGAADSVGVRARDDRQRELDDLDDLDDLDGWSQRGVIQTNSKQAASNKGL